MNEPNTNMPSLLELRAMRDEKKRQDKDAVLTMQERNEHIAHRHLVDGESISALGREYGVSRQRIYQIINGL